MKTIVRFIPIVLLVLLMTSCKPAQTDEGRLRDFIASHVKQIEPKITANNIAEWNANASGEKRYYDESAALDLEIKRIRSNKTEFAFLKQLKEGNTIHDSLLQRQLTFLYNNYLKNQIDTTLLRAIVEKQSAIASRFNTFRGKIDGKEVADNDISSVLKDEKNPEKRKKAWEASKQVGKEVAPMVIELVKLRNQAAKQLGFENYYVMALATDEQDANDIIGVFDNLEQLTHEPFAQMKHDLDARLAKKFGVQPGQLRPWHYEDPFFQEAPQSPGVDLDTFFKGKNIEELGQTFYAGLGLPVEDILKRSDLIPRKGKYQHAFENDMDRSGDVRVMLSISDNHYWTSTLLHELGHGVYSKYVDRNLPYLLRVEAHTFLTEAIAQLMERQCYNPGWLQTMVNITDKDKEAVRKTQHENLRSKELVFSRWSQVMVRFERSLYQIPDQDLNRLWWDLVEKYQLVTRPDNRNEPDWAAKIHLAQYPCYYHNYLLGEMAASQILNAIVTRVEKLPAIAEISFAQKPAIGEFLKTQVFMPGASLHWSDLLKHATGEGLTPKYFAEEFTGN
ncbi:MAG TPA: peptidase M3 [Bacteroidetes bacterium]|nr:peptidase M3 [Bacteroidota bacterium]